MLNCSLVFLAIQQKIIKFIYNSCTRWISLLELENLFSAPKATDENIHPPCHLQDYNQQGIWNIKDTRYCRMCLCFLSRCSIIPHPWIYIENTHPWNYIDQDIGFWKAHTIMIQKPGSSSLITLDECCGWQHWCFCSQIPWSSSSSRSLQFPERAK